jgi:DNA-binding MarR family transcriptional regulator
MNEIIRQPNEDLLDYQTGRLQDLIGEIIDCCEDRKLYESQKFAVPYAELRCLLLFDGERYLTVKGISQKMDVAKSRVSKIIDSLIEKGLVERFEDPRDSRIKLISLTTQGQNLAAQARAFHQEIHRNLLLYLGEEERKSILSQLERLRSAMEAVKEQFL